MRTFVLTVQGKLGTNLRALPWDPQQHTGLSREGRAVVRKRQWP